MNTLTSRVITSLWFVFTNIAAKFLIHFGRMVILWRILNRAEFGLNGMAWTAINLATLLQDMGFSQELIRRKHDLAAAISVTWYANVAIRLVIYAAIYFAAPLIAIAFKEPAVVTVLRVAGLCIILGAFGSANEAILRKEFKFRLLTIIDGLEMLIQATAQIVLALLGYGVWSLVYGSIICTVARSVLLWWLSPIRVGRFDTRVAWEMFHFGKHMTISTIGLSLIKNMDYFFVGRYLGKEALGVYTLGFKMSDFIAVNVIRSLGSVLYPAYSEAASDRDRLRGAWLRSVRFSMLFVLPMGVGLMLFCGEIIRTFYKNQEVIIVPMAILIVWSLLRGIGSPTGDLAKAIGKPAILTRAVLWHAVIMAPALYVVTGLLHLELEGALIAVSSVVAAAPFAGLLVCLIGTSKEVRFTTKQVFGALLPSFASGACMVAVTLVSKLVLGLIWPSVPPAAMLCIVGPLSAIFYALALLRLFPSTATELRQLLDRRKSGRKAADTKAATPVG